MPRSMVPLFAAAFVASAPALAADVVPVPRFDSVQLRGGGNVMIVPGPTERVTILEGSAQVTRFQVDRRGRLIIDACNRNCPRFYRLRIEIQSPDVPDLGIHGGGAIRVMKGFRAQRHIAAAVNGGGRIDTRALDATAASAAVNGGGEVLVRARANVSAAVNGGGLVRYAGNPRVSSAVQGGGAVTRAD